MWLSVVIAVITICVMVGAVRASLARAAEGPQPPDYPGGWPLIGHGHLFASGNSVALMDLVTDIYRFGNTCGGVVSCRIGLTKCFMISDPDDCVTLANTALEKDFIYDFIKPMLGHGLLTAPVPLWKVHRKLLTPAFSQGVLDGFVGVFNSQGKRLVNALNQEDGKEPFDFWKYMGPNALETICLTAMGGAKADGRLSDEYIHVTEDTYNIVVQRFKKFWLHSNFIFDLSALGRKMMKNTKIVHDFTRSILQRKKSELLNGSSTVADNSGTKFKAFIDLLMAYADEGVVFSDEEIIDEVNTIIMAGHDTSASTTVFALILLGSHPEIQDRVFNEIKEVLGDKDVEKDDLPDLVFLEAVLKETMRLYPIAPFVVRKLTESVRLKNYTLPAGSGAFLAYHALHRDKMWGDDAELFVPDRWLDRSRIPRHQAAFAAFSVGRRMCIGKNYALMAMKTSLVHLVRSYRFKSDISKLQLKLDIMLRPHAGNYISIERRT